MTHTTRVEPQGWRGVSGLPLHPSARPWAGSRGQEHPRREDRQVPLPSRVPLAGETKRCSWTGRGSSERAPQCGPRAVPRLGQRQAWGGCPAAESSRQSQDRSWDGLGRKASWAEQMPHAKALWRVGGKHGTRRTQRGWSVRARGRGHTGQLQPDLKTCAGPRSLPRAAESFGWHVYSCSSERPKEHSGQLT